MDTKFLKAVQEKGWHIEAATEESVIAKCPSAGCNLRAELRFGGHVPDVDPGCKRNLLDQEVTTYDDLRTMLRSRRDNLRLSIREVEEIAGMPTDHLAKIEHDGMKRLPNFQFVMEWAAALGFEVVLRPIPMTSYAIRTICDTRDKVASRTKRLTIEQRRRGGKTSRSA